MLSSLLNFDPDFINDSLDDEERARIEVDEDTILIILKVPIKNEKNEKIPYKTISLGIIIGVNYVLFATKYKIEFLEKMIEKNLLNPNKKSKMIFEVFFENSKLFLNYLKEINKKIDASEEELHNSMRNYELETLMYLEKSLVYFTTSLRSNEIMMEKLLRGKLLELYEEDQELLEDSLIENKQAIEVTNIYSNILSGMMDAYASVISNNLNIAMKVLTVVTIILQIPTIITSFYGMNVKLPLQESPLTYIGIISSSIIAMFLIFLLFKRKKWL
jgi:magnesium transporter